MILKRYGDKLHSVRPNFDANAMTEVSFRRDREAEFTPEEFAARFEWFEERQLTATSEGQVKSLAEHAALHYLEEQVLDLEQQVRAHAVLVVENATGADASKTRSTQRTLVEAGENRLFFTFRIDPPLRLSIHRRRH
ncbi:MAG: hypothetical protein FIB01_11120 [Gemmatimonadetes bacterium]|nr:hypothetical protein [Gemmatimonadota bacterium]